MIKASETDYDVQNTSHPWFSQEDFIVACNNIILKIHHSDYN